MGGSILLSVKKMLGIDSDYKHFDEDLIMHINSVVSILYQIGVGPENGFRIDDADAYWNDFISDDKNLELVKSYVYLKVRLLFDPTTNSALTESINRQISELEWRITLSAEPTYNGEGEIQNG